MKTVNSSGRPGTGSTKVLLSFVVSFLVISASADSIEPVIDSNLTADGGGPYEANEGETIVFDASGSQGPEGMVLQYRWDFDGDGVWDTPLSVSPMASHVWSDDHAGLAYVEVQVPGGDPSTIEIIGSLVGGGTVVGEEQRAQSFVAAFELLTQVSADVSLNRNEVPNAPLTLSIRSDINGLDLTSVQVKGAGMPVGLVENWVIFDVPDTVLTPGNTYWVVLYSNADNAPYEPHATLDVYPEGTAWGTGAGGGWVPSPTIDFRMKLAGTDVTASAIDTAQVTVSNVAPTLSPPASVVVAEGDHIALSAAATDPGSDDLTFVWSWQMGPTETSAFPNDGTYPFTVSDISDHVYGDDGTFLVTLIVEDDDGGVGTAESVVAVANVAPSVSLSMLPLAHEADPLTFEVRAIDAGSDDLTYFWSGDCTGWSAAPILYPNDPAIIPDPYPSPEINPRDVTDTQSVVCGDDGSFTWNVQVKDDDGGSTLVSGIFSVENLPPILKVSPPIHLDVDEGTEVTLNATVTDPGSDDLTFTWSWEHGITETRVYYNDGLGPDPPKSPKGVFPFSVTDSSSYTYGDDCSCVATLTVVDDDGGTVVYETVVEVVNVAPMIVGDVMASVRGNLTLRIAGEKWHDVVLSLNRNGNPARNVTATRKPGSPDNQSVTIDNLEVDMLSNALSVNVKYTPIDDPVNGKPYGATPAWLIFQSDDGVEARLHHAFNVRHEDTWTLGVEDIRSLMIGIPITFMAVASDPGSDDLTFEWLWGDGTSNASNVYYNDGLGPDPFPSPDVNPITVVEVASHAFLMAGRYTVSVTVEDDDGGEATTTLTIML